MATDTTTTHTDVNNASTIHESDVEQAHLTQAGAPVQVQVPQGENVVRVQMTPGETVELPFPTDGLVARLGDNGNLAVKVGDVTVILVGYADATGQGDITILGNDGKSVDVAAVLASTDPNLDIQTAAGPGAGDQGTGADNNGGVFAPFDPNAGLGGLNAIGGLDPTALQYNLIQREIIQFEEDDEIDTEPTVVNITQANPVNEDDFHGHRSDDLIDRLNPKEEPVEELPASRQSLQGEGEHAPKWVLGKTYDDGNDPFDTTDHEDGSQTGVLPDDSNGSAPGGIDMDREPLSVTAVVEANFFNDLPGKLVLDANGDGTGDVPLITVLEGMNLSSHGHDLTFKLLPEIPESSPGANDGQGQMVIAYYTIIQHGCPVNVVVFSIGVDDDVVNAGETNPAGNAEFGLTFSIYGVLDHPEKNVEDILNIKVPFFLDDSDSAPVPSDFPQDLVFQDIDDKPFLGEVCYVTVPCFGDIPIAIHQANLTIGHDETPGVQHTNYDTNGNAPGGHETTDDTSSNWPINAAEWKLEGIANGNPSGENVDISYQQGILSKLAPEFLKNGNFCADALGSAKSQIDVSFGADGKAKGNDQAGTTLFNHDNAQGEGTDTSTSNFNADGTPKNNEDGGTDKRAFELFMHQDGASEPNTDSSLTNWTITIMVNGEPVVIQVTAYQLDANTIIGLATPPVVEGGEGNDTQAARVAVDDEGGISGTGSAIPVFMLTLDPSTGQLTFVQYHQINNPLGGDASPYDWDHSANDPINLLDGNGKPLVYFQATDFDGDSVTAQLKVSVIDDAPDAKDDKVVLDEENAGAGGYNAVSGNLVLGIGNDNINSNNNGKDKLSVDHDHTIPALKYGNSTISFDFKLDTVTVTGTDATNVTFDGHVVEFDTPHGHFKVVVDSDHADPVAPGDNSFETDELGYYEYTSKPGNNSDKDHYGLEKTSNGTVDPEGSTDAQKISSILQTFNGIKVTNNFDSNSADNADWGLKTIDAGGAHYTGIGVKSGIDGGETDTDSNAPGLSPEIITIEFPNDVDAAKITVGALFDGQLYDAGNAEAIRWVAYDGNTKVGEGVIYGDYDGLVDFFVNVGHDFNKITLTPLDNGAGNNGNNSDFLLVGVTTCEDLCITEELKYVLKDADGDYDTAKLTLEVEDGKPRITSCEEDLSITIDEDGLPTGNNNNVNSASGDSSDNVGGDNGPGDADGSEATAQGHISFNTYADGLAAVYLSSTSDVKTIDGKSITWAWDAEGSRLIGYATPDTDRIVVEVLLENANNNGVDFKIVLHEPLDHPSNNSEDNLYLDIKVTVADKDCDIDTANIHVKIDDDTPEAKVTRIENAQVLIDETSGNQGGTDDKSSLQPNPFQGLGSPIQVGQSATAIVNALATKFGADGAAASNSVVFSIEPSSNGANSGLQWKDGNGNVQNIQLFQQGDVVVGKVGNVVIFAVAIGQDGKISVAEYKPIYHDPNNGPDDVEGIVNAALKVKVTVTDGDGDKDTDYVDVGSAVKFRDDAPASMSDEAAAIVEDEQQSGGIDENNDANPDYGAVVNGNVSDNGNWGADGFGSITSVKIDNNSSVNVPAGGQVTVYWNQSGGYLGTNSNGAAFSLVVKSNGQYTYTQLDNLLKSGDGEQVDVLGHVTFTGKDGDGDQATIGLDLKVKDDVPGSMSDENAAIVEDEQQSGGIDENDASPDYGAVVNGDVSNNGSWGADGFGGITSVKIDANNAVNVPAGGQVTVYWNQTGGYLGTNSNGAAFSLLVKSNGQYTFTQTDNLLKSGNGEQVDILGHVTFTGKDGDGDTATIGLDLKVKDDVPGSMEDQDLLIVEDEQLNPSTDEPNDDTPDYGSSGSGDVSNNGSWGADGFGGITAVAVGQSSVNVPAGGQVTVYWNQSGVFQGTNSNGAAFNLVIKSNGEYTFTQTDNLLKSGNGEQIDFLGRVVFTGKDGDGDTATIGLDIKVKDDVPTITVSKGTESGVILETQDAQTIGSNSDTATSSANFSGVFGWSKNGGADGEQSSSLTYALGVSAQNSGLTIGGATINLFKLGNGDVIGTTANNANGANDGNTVFRVHVASDGTVTLTQYQQVDHANAEGAPSYDDDVRTLADGKITLTANGSITDNDGDTATDSKTIDLGGNIRFDDDGPNAVNDGNYTVQSIVNGAELSGNLVTGAESQNNGVNGTDSYGADGPGEVTAVQLNGGAWVNLGVNGADIVTAQGTLHVNKDGSWTFDQTGTQSVNYVFNYRLKDGDGDTDDAQFSITTKLVQPAPTWTYASANVDEDGLTGGIKDDVNAVDGQPGDNVTGAGGGDSSEKTFGGVFADLLDGDNVTDISLNGNVPGDFAGIKNLAGQAVDTVVITDAGHTLVAMAGGVELFKVEITSVANATFKVTLLNPIQHTDPTLEDNISATVKVWATNGGGTTQAGIVINIDDDRPVVTPSTQAAPSLQVDETNSYGLPDTKSVGGLFNPVNFGADGAAASNSLVYSLTGANGQPIGNGTPSGLTDLNGTAINLYNEGGNIVGRVGAANGIIAFQLSINGSNVTLQQVWPIKHVAGDPNDNLTSTLNQIYVTLKATDKDGDVTQVTSSGALTLNFRDDGPSAGSNASIILDDDNQANGNNARTPGTGDDTPQNATGTLAHSYGTDGAGTTLLANATLPVDGNFTQSLSNGGKLLTILQDGVAVLTITLSNDTAGSYTVTQLKAIKHPDAQDENDVVFFINYVVKDGDGDTTPGTINLKIDDDVPIVTDDTDTVTTFGVVETGNVLTNDFVGADTPGKVVSFKVGNDTWAADGAVHTISTGTIKMNADGTYEYKQTSGSAGSFVINYTIEDADKDQASGKLTMTTKDQPVQHYIVVGENVNDTDNQTTDHRIDNTPNAPDGPIDGAAGNDVLIGDVGGKETIVVPGNPYSIALVCDTSTSMSTDDRIGLLKSAVTNFVNTLPTGGTINLTLIAFGSVAATKITVTLDTNNKASVLNAIAALQAGQNADGHENSFTNYEAALLAAKAYMATQPAGNEKLVYFMTDGVPTAYNGNTDGDGDGDTDLNEITPALTAVNSWMVNNPAVKLHAIGLDIDQGAMNLLRYFDNTNLQVGTVQTNVEGGSVTDNYGQPLNITSSDELVSALTGGSTTTNVFPVGNDLINGGAGNDAILGDTIYSGAPDLGWQNYVDNHAGWTNEQMRADIYANLTTGNHSYAGEGTVGGNDTINAGAGNDYVYGQGGNDIIHGDADNDQLFGGSGNDQLFGDDGNDFLNGGTGIDALSGGAGNDTLVWDSQDSFNGGADFDRVQVVGGGADFTYTGTGGSAKFTGVEMIDLGDSNDRSGSANQNTVHISAADVLDLGNSGTLVTAGTAGQVRIDLFVVGDNNGSASGRDNVDLSGFSQVDINGAGGGANSGNGTFDHTDPVTGVQHTYTLWSDGGSKLIAIEQNLDVS